MIYELSLLLPVVVAHRLTRSGEARKEELDRILDGMERKLKSIIGVRVPLKNYERVPFFLEYFEVRDGVIRPKRDREYLDKAVKWHVDSLEYLDRTAMRVLREVLRDLDGT